MRLHLMRTIGWLALAGLVVTATVRAAPVPHFRLGGGLRIVAVHARPGPTVRTGSPTVPLEGPQLRVALTATDQADPDAFGFASAHVGLSGNPLTGNADDLVFAIMDSGAGAHIIGHADSVSLGLVDAWISGASFQAGGVGGSVTFDMSMPVGLFMHGVQDLGPGRAFATTNGVGQGNVVVGVNSASNAASGIEVPTVVGAPLFAQFAVWVRAGQRLALPGGASCPVTPAVTVMDPESPDLPTLSHRAFLQLLPSGGDPVFLPDLLGETGDPMTPTTIGLASALFLTANNLTVTHGVVTAQGYPLVDTGAQGTVLSTIAATELGLNLADPDFSVDVEGFGGAVTAPGFVLDRLSLPAQGGSLAWTNVPVLVLDIPSPEGAGKILFGILGMNLFGDRDLLFNGTATPPYLDVSEPVTTPALQISGVQATGSGTVNVAWCNLPAPGRLVLETSPSLDAPVWTPAQTAALSTIQGAFTLTNFDARAFFRLAGR